MRRYYFLLVSGLIRHDESCDLYRHAERHHDSAALQFTPDASKVRTKFRRRGFQK
jgi:hypothetical protein